MLTLISSLNRVMAPMPMARGRGIRGAPMGRGDFGKHLILSIHFFITQTHQIYYW